MSSSYLARLRRSWVWSSACALWLGLGLLPLYFFQTTVHEGSHCVVAAVTGIGCGLLVPVPTTYQGRPLNGLTIMDGSSVAIIVAPELFAAFLIVVLRLASSRVRVERWALLARLWLLGACVDLLNNTAWRPHGPSGDWSAMANEVGLSSGTVHLLSTPLWAIALWGLFAPLPSSFPEPLAKVRDLSGIGVFYALVSAGAVALATLLTVPDTDPTTLWHQVPILLQAGSVVVCLAVVAGCRLGVREAA